MSWRPASYQLDSAKGRSTGWPLDQPDGGAPAPARPDGGGRGDQAAFGSSERGPCRWRAVNVETEFGRRLADELRAAGTPLHVWLEPDAQYCVATVEWDVSRATVRLDTLTGSARETTGLPGLSATPRRRRRARRDRLTRAPAGAGAGRVAQTPGSPGRWGVGDCGQRFDVIVDFADTPAGLVASRIGLPRARCARRCCSRVRRRSEHPFKRRPVRHARRLADRVTVTEGTGVANRESW